jgi:NDP-sugar pyrophosphorylase family protein
VSREPGQSPSVATLWTMDLVFWVVLAAVITPGLLVLGTAVWLGARIHPALSLLFVPPALPVALIGGIVVLRLLRMLVPALQPGRHAFPGSPQARAWAVHFLLMRIGFLPVWKGFILGSAPLRALLLRALGADVAWGAMCSSDVVITDPSLLTLGDGCVVGTGVIVAGHLVVGRKLVLDRVTIGPRAQVHAVACLAPGCVIGEEAVIGLGARLGPNVNVGPRAQIGGATLLYGKIRVGENARIGHGCSLARGVVVGKGAQVNDRAHVPAGTVIPDGARFPSDEHPHNLTEHVHLHRKEAGNDGGVGGRM